MKFLLILGLWIATTLGWSAPQALRPENTTQQDVSDVFVSQMVPEEVQLNPEILKNSQENWEINRKSWGYGSQTIWLRGQLENPSDQSVERILSLPYASPTEADFYVYNASGQLIKKVQAGTYAPLEGRELKLNLIGIKLEFPPRGQLTVLIRQKSKSLLDSHYVLRTVEDHQAVEWIYLAAYGLYFGLALGLFFHNLSLYFSVRDSVYLYYLGFVVCISMAMLFSSAFYALFWYRLPNELHSIPYATPAFLNVGAALFIFKYLHIKLRDKWIAYCLLGIIVVSMALSCLHIYRPDFATPLNLYLNLGAIGVYAWACILRISQGERYAWFLLVAVLSPMLTVMAYYAGNILFKISVPSDLISAAFALEMLLMSTGLAHRVYMLRQRQHQLQSEQAHLIHQSKMRALSDMSSGVAHEVNNPLMIISGYAEVIRRLMEHTPLEKDRIRESAIKIDQNVNRIAFIVNALRSFARDEEEQIPDRISLTEIVQQALSLCTRRIQDRGITLEVDPGPMEYWVIGVKPVVLEVVLGLLDNAMEALSEAPQKRLLVQMKALRNAEPPRLRLTVQDSGPGIPAELKSHLFQPFFTTRPVGEGAGLSLSRSLGIIQSMKGTLTYERQDEVTRFVMEIPLAAAESLPTENIFNKAS